MITITGKANCCGCRACANVCPKQCISMKADEEGFLYPHVDTTACVNCNLCKKVCPVLHKPATYPILETYAAKHKSTDVKLKSSSGGIFTSLAEVILQEGGVVFGAAFDAQWNVVHTYVENLQDLDKLRRSKYVQSDIGTTYQQAKAFLDQGRTVLFTGTSCQIAGLRNFLGKEYENLLTADIICHAVPSPTVWQKFLRENLDVAKLKAINFRDKKISWSAFYLSFLTSDGLNAHGKTQTLAERFLKCRTTAAIVYRNTFLKAFLQELINRPACHACHFKGRERLADFTLGDLWGKWPDIVTQEDKKYGVSALLVNTAKGQSYFGKISSSFTCQKADVQRVRKFNPALDVSTAPHPKRAEFFARYQTENVSKLIKELLPVRPLPVQLVQMVTKRIFPKRKKG